MKTRICLFSAIVLFLYCGAIAQPDQQVSSLQVLIIKAAGYIEGEDPQGTDTTTEATSIGRNVHVVSQAVADELNGRDIPTAILPFNEITEIQGIIRQGIDIIVFAGPAYSSRFPDQLQELVPLLSADIVRTHTVCTSLTTCRFLDSGGWTVQAFDKKLKEHGIQTTESLVVHHEHEDEDWETKVRSFAEQIQTSL